AFKRYPSSFGFLARGVLRQSTIKRIITAVLALSSFDCRLRYRQGSCSSGGTPGCRLPDRPYSVCSRLTKGWTPLAAIIDCDTEQSVCQAEQRGNSTQDFLFTLSNKVLVSALMKVEEVAFSD
ncbi:hypothetical protein KUCAC02_033722, partial [Chaenocephalus aceratus]